MVLMPGVAGELLKIKLIVVSPFDRLTLSAGIRFTVKSLASRVAGSTGSLTLRLNSVGGAVTIPPQPAVLTEQGGGVGVGVGLGIAPWIYLIVAKSELNGCDVRLAPVT
jgi:hypothetical protein